MLKLEFTLEELKAYFADDKPCTHHFYKDAIKECDDMSYHADGKFPERLIEERRPNEALEVLDYRKLIWIPKTKPFFSKIISSLSKIRRSSDWSINYGNDDFSRIAEGESLEDYCEKNYPVFSSLTNWFFSVWLKKYLVDPNSVVFIYPEEEVIDPTQYVKPILHVFDSCDVLDYKHNNYAVLVNPIGCTYTTSKGTYPGKSFYVVTTQTITRYDQINGRGEMKAFEYTHGLGFLPVYQIGAMIKCSEGSEILYESRISGIKPEFDEALREYSDLQAAKVIHLYPERWEYSQHECTDCKGTTLRPNPNYYEGCGCETHIKCTTCQGKGYVVAGPYSKIVVKPAGTGEQPLPNPPAGYIEKDVEIIKVQEESVERHIYNGLAAINFEFLKSTPLNQSGVAKEVDKDELNNTVHSIAEDLVRNMDWCYKTIAFYRYKLLYSKEEILMMLPSIAVPEKYDILSNSHLETSLNSAKQNKANPAIINALEIEYANKTFNSNPHIRDMVELILKLDPLSNVSEEDKMSRLSNKGISLETYVISSNINNLVEKAIDEDEGFIEKPLKEQKLKIKELAKEYMPEAQVIVEITDEEDELQRNPEENRQEPEEI